MEKRKIILINLFLIASSITFGQDVNSLVQKIRSKIERVSSYEAEGTMKTNVSFLKVPDAKVKIFFKKPDKLKIKNENGISLVPKSILGMGLNNLLNGNFTALDAGMSTLGQTKVRVIKLIPVDDSGEIVLSTIYVDETNSLIEKAKIATKGSGSYEIDMSYGKYMEYALPDHVECTFNIKDYKLPKGVTLDYDDGSKKTQTDKLKDARGKVEIIYNSYSVNKPIPDSVF